MISDTGCVEFDDKVVSEMGGVVSEMGGVVSEMGGVVSEMGGVVPEMGGVVPEMGGVVPEMGGVVSEDVVVSGPDFVELNDSVVPCGSLVVPEDDSLGGYEYRPRSFRPIRMKLIPLKPSVAELAGSLEFMTKIVTTRTPTRMKSAAP